MVGPGGAVGSKLPATANSESTNSPAKANPPTIFVLFCLVSIVLTFQKITDTYGL
jgi:hypothetical protein